MSMVKIKLKDLAELHNQVESLKSEAEWLNKRNDDSFKQESEITALRVQIDVLKRDLFYERERVRALSDRAAQEAKIALSEENSKNPAKFQLKLEELIRDAHRENGKISAIKGIRELTGLGLRDAKDLYERAIGVIPRDY